MAIPRTARERIQREAGERGIVRAYRSQADWRHAATGWYIRPAAAVEGCTCSWCEAARVGRDHYLGANDRRAVQALGDHEREHEGLGEVA